MKSLLNLQSGEKTRGEKDTDIHSHMLIYTELLCGLTSGSPGLFGQGHQA